MKAMLLYWELGFNPVIDSRRLAMAKSYKRGRDAKTGRFNPVKEAERRKSTAVVETVVKKR